MRLAPLFLIAAIAPLFGTNTQAEVSFTEARASFHTKLIRHLKIGEPAETPPTYELILI